MSKKLEFEASNSDKQIKDVLRYDAKAFLGIPEQKWNIDSIKEDISKGWTLFSVKYDGEIVAALMVKEEESKLLTIHSSIRMAFQGNGFSHQIKEFLESKAKQEKAQKVINYCLRDNFRGTALNESHGYHKVGMVKTDEIEFEEWEKKIK